MSDTKTSMVRTLKQKLNETLNRLLKSRKHCGENITLNHSNIYVLPSKFGLAYLFLNSLIYILGVNYQNNLVLLFSYLMVSFLLVNFLFAFLNLRNLTLKFNGLNPGYVHTSLELNLSISNLSGSESVYLSHPNAETRYLDKINEDNLSIKLNLRYARRGKKQIDKIKIMSQNPFGLVSAWSYFFVDKSAYIYPTPHSFSIHQVVTEPVESEHSSSLNAKKNSEYYQGVRPFTEGDKINRISWKHYAKHQVLASKDFSSITANEYVFTLQSVPGNLEQKLQHLSYLITHAYHDSLPFSLVLPNKQIPLGTNKAHMTSCLEALSDV